MKLTETRIKTVEISAVFLTAIGKFVFMDFLDLRLGFILVVISFWLFYTIFRLRFFPMIANHWGFRLDNFNRVLSKVLPFGLVAVALFLLIGWYQNSINLTWHIVPILVLYPIWGTLQQFLLIALTTGNLYDLKGSKWKKEVIVFISAILFSIIHYPYPWLMAGTFVLAIFYGWIYLSDRNIYVLGLFHGWLGGIFYYTVLNRDPFVETFGNLFNLSN